MAENKYFLRRDMDHGLTVMVGEEKGGTGQPYAAVATIHSPRGHMILIMRQDGSFAVEIHPDGGEAVDIIGVIDLFAATIEKVGDVEIEPDMVKPRMN